MIEELIFLGNLILLKKNYLAAGQEQPWRFGRQLICSHLKN